MARNKRAVFNSFGPFVARVAFRFNGAIYTAGALLQHEKINPRRLRQLYQSRKIDFQADSDIKKVAPIEPFDWRKLDEKGIMDYAFEQTGKRFRKLERAVKELEDIC